MGKSKPVDIGDGMAVLSPGEITVTDDESVPYDLRLLVAIEDGKAAVNSITAERRKDGPPVTAVGLRQVAIQRILREAFGLTLMRVRPDSTGNWTGSPVDYRDESEALVATYRLALAVGYPPVQAVAKWFEVSPSTARSRVASARAKGLLSPTTKGKAKG